MKLTGKCLGVFESWWYKLKLDEKIFKGYECVIDDFYDSLSSMQYGIYVDFFDSVGIDIQATSIIEANHIEYVVRVNLSIIELSFKTRHEARTEAIKKANEIYNN